MKNILLILIGLFCFISCAEDNYKDIEIRQLDGKWYSERCIFEMNSTDENFTVTTKEHIATCYFGLTDDKKALSLVYMEDEEGNELMTEEDYDNGHFCPFTLVNKKKLKISNLPYFPNKELEFHK